MTSLQTLMNLAAQKAITDHSSLRNNACFLPRAVLECLLASSIRQKKILAVRELLSHWPFKDLLLRNVGQEFEESHAVLFAFTLQKSNNILEIIDMKGCRTGFHGTTAFCKLALGFPVSQNDVSERIVIDSCLLSQVEDCVPCLSDRIHPITVILDCYVNMDNYQLMKQALVKHSILDIKACNMKLVELGKRNICSLVSLIEPDIINLLDLSMNSLEADGIIQLCTHLKTFRNLKDLNISYNFLTHNNQEAIATLADTFTCLPQLERLTLTENNLGHGVVTLLQSIQNPLTHLIINGCGIRRDVLHSLCNIELLHQLQYLELSTNALVNCTSSMVKFVLKSSQTLKYLYIEDNMFTTETVEKLCTMVKKLEKLEFLSICYNHLLPDDVQTIKNAIPHVQVINRDWLF